MQADQPGAGIFVSAISGVAVIYLVEKGKLPQASLDALVATLTDPAEATQATSSLANAFSQFAQSANVFNQSAQVLNQAFNLFSGSAETTV